MTDDQYFRHDDRSVDEIVDVNGDPLPRIFDAALMPSYRLVPRERLIVYNSEKQVFQLQKMTTTPGYPPNTIEVEEDTVVVYGSWGHELCSPAAWAVYLGPGSRYNATGLIDLDPDDEVISRGEIEGLSRAVDVAAEICAAEPSLCKIRITCLTEFDVKGLGLLMKYWIKGEKLEWKPDGNYFDLLKRLSEKVDRILSAGRDDLDIKFWWILADDHYREATTMAREASRGYYSEYPD